MELIFPWVLYIGIPILIILPLFGFKKKDRFKKGSRVANTNQVENTELYKKLMRKYKIFCAFALVALLIAIGCSFVIMARPAKLETKNQEIHNRDIFLCMDISGSVDQLNLDMIEELRGVIRDLEGERVGITIFNAKSILLVPLTTDYAYVLGIMDELEKSFKESIKLSEYYQGNVVDTSFLYTFDYEAYNYKYEGTLSEYGSSFIGDGLASCLFNFPDIRENKDRTRIIIFTTDNELNGTPIVTVKEATDLCKKYGVKVFAISPKNIVDEKNFKADIEKTGGRYYNNTDTGVYKSLVDEIKGTEASSLVVTRTFVFEHPQLFFVILVVAEGLFVILSKRMKL